MKNGAVVSGWGTGQECFYGIVWGIFADILAAVIIGESRYRINFCCDDYMILQESGAAIRVNRYAFAV